MDQEVQDAHLDLVDRDCPLKSYNNLLYCEVYILSKIDLMVELCFTTGPLAPGPPSVPMGPYELENYFITLLVQQRED